MKIVPIIKKEYRMIVKKKSFVISTILTPMIMGLFIFLPMLITKVGRGEKTIAIADFSGFVSSEFQELSQSTGTSSLTFVTVDVDSKQSQSVIDEYTGLILRKEVDGLLFIPANVKKERKAFFYALNISDFETNRFISSTIQNVVSKQVLIEQDIDHDLVKEATRGILFETLKVKREGVSKSSSGTEYMMSIFMLTILFSIIMAYGQLIMRGVIEEKNNRIIEVLISSTNSYQLFYGKIIGIGLAGLTQVAIWMAMGALILGRTSLGISAGILNFLTLELGIYFIIFFIIGYFMYSILFSIVGASVNTDQEAQQFAAPITYLLIVPFIVGILITQNPNTTLVTVASFFPLFTPTLMFMRISVAVPAFVQILASIVSSILFTVFLAWLGAKIFRIGILMYGKKPSLKEIIRWLRHR